MPSAGWLILTAGAVLFLIVLWRRRTMTSPALLQQLKADGAQIVDVRSVAEYVEGHGAGSVNIPVDQLPARFRELDATRPVLLCCASGARAAWAQQFLRQNGFEVVHNAGPWQRLAS